jgi:hypothetical protein
MGTGSKGRHRKLQVHLWWEKEHHYLSICFGKLKEIKHRLRFCDLWWRQKENMKERRMYTVFSFKNK